MLYNVVGSISSIFFLGCLVGLVDQIIKIRRRQRNNPTGKMGFATASLSVNAFFSSFIAFYAFFLYSIMLEGIELYMFSTRLCAALMVLAVLYLIYKDRPQWSQRMPFVVGVLCMLLAGLALWLREDILSMGRVVSITLALVATFFLVQGGISQIRKISKHQSTGVLSLPMNIVFCGKDLSNIGFGMVLGFVDGWPVLLLAVVSATIKLVIIAQFYLYREESTQVT